MRSKSWSTARYTSSDLFAASYAWYNLAPTTILPGNPELVIEKCIGDMYLGDDIGLVAQYWAVDMGLIVMPVNMILTGGTPPALAPTAQDGGLEWLWTKFFYATTGFPAKPEIPMWHIEIDSSARRRMESSSEILWLYINNYGPWDLDLSFNIRYLTSEA